MDILSWLAKAGDIVSEGLAFEMLEAFRETEVPAKDVVAKKRYLDQMTGSRAAQSVAESVKELLRADFTNKMDDILQN